MELKDVLKRKRLERGLTMKELADRVGVSEGSISRWESGDVDNMKRRAITNLCKELDIAPSFIMGLDEPYYNDLEVAQIAEEMYSNNELRILFKASRNLSKKDIMFIKDIVESMKKRSDYND